MVDDSATEQHTSAGAAGRQSPLRSVLEATADGLLVVGMDGRIQLANRRFAELWRIPPKLLERGDDDALIAFAIEQLDQPDLFLERVRELYAQPEAESFDILHFRDGRVYERYSCPQRDGAAVIGRVWSFRDVSDRERAAAGLVASEVRFRTLVEQLPAVIYIDDLDYAVSYYVSPQAQAVLGYSAEHLSTLSAWDDAVYPEDRAVYQEKVEQCLATRTPFRHSHRWVRPDGSVIWVREHEEIVDDATGRPYRQGTVIDVTEVVEAQAQLRRAERIYRDLVEQLPAAVYLSEVAGPCQYVSPQIEQLYGITQDEFIGGGWRSVIHPADLKSVADMVRAAHAAGQGAEVEYRITHRRTGEVRWMHEQTALVDVPGAAVPVVQGLISDTTDRTRAVEALRASEAERRDAVASLLRAAEMERARVAAELHDDTVQILTGAVLTADRLRRDVATLDAPVAQAQADRLRQLLGNAIERTRRLMFELSPQLLQAGGIAAAVRELAESNGAEAGFAVSVEGELPRYPAEVEALVYRTLREAILNARKHARCTLLEIDLDGGTERMRCSVRDNGVGFVPAETATRWDAHLHLGLRSAMERITLAGGTLAVDSVPGAGTTITLNLPLTP